MSFQERASSPISSVERTGTRAPRSPAPASLHGDAQPLHRAHHEGPQEHQGEAEHPGHRAHQPGGHLALRRREGGVDPGHRELDVEDAEHALGAGCSWQAVHFGSL